MSKRIGQYWSDITLEEKNRYQQQSSMERQRVATQIEQAMGGGGNMVPDSCIEQANHSNSNCDNNNNNNNNNSSTVDLIYPVGRIRKICRLDPDVKNLSKEAIYLITKCTELATKKLGMEAVKVARMQNRRKLLPDDIAHVCTHREPFLFLKDDVKDLLTEQRRIQAEQQQRQRQQLDGGNNNNNTVGEEQGPQQQQQQSGSTTSRKDAIRETAAVGSRRLTSYFGTVPSSSSSTLPSTETETWAVPALAPK
jgi:histone H3/H4